MALLFNINCESLGVNLYHTGGELGVIDQPDLNISSGAYTYDRNLVGEKDFYIVDFNAEHGRTGFALEIGQQYGTKRVSFWGIRSTEDHMSELGKLGRNLSQQAEFFDVLK